MTPSRNLKGSKQVIANALNHAGNREAFQIIHGMRKDGATFQRIANYLNESGLKTRRGNTFSRSSTRNFYDRFLRYYDEQSGELKTSVLKVTEGKFKTAGVLTKNVDGQIEVLDINKMLGKFLYLDLLKSEDADLLIKILGHLYLSAEKKITITNYLHGISRADDRVDWSEYYDVLNQIATKADICYDRVLQVPDSIWKFLALTSPCHSYKDISLHIFSSLLLSSQLRSHLLATRENANSPRLFVLKIQRTFSTMAIVDDHVLIEEDNYITAERRKFTDGMKFYTQKDSGSDKSVQTYIRRIKSNIYKVLEKAANYSCRIDEDVFRCLLKRRDDLKSIRRKADLTSGQKKVVEQLLLTKDIEVPSRDTLIEILRDAVEAYKYYIQSTDEESFLYKKEGNLRKPIPILM